MAFPQVIVRVGKTSDLRLRNIKAYRAVAFKDVVRLLDLYPNTTAIIMQDISTGEIALAENTLNRFIERGKSVFFYAQQPSGELANFASNMDSEIATSLEELQSNIAKELSLRVSTKWGLADTADQIENNTQENRDEHEEKDNRDLTEAIIAVKESKPTQITHPTIKNKEDLAKLGGEDEDYDSFSLSDIYGTIHNREQPDRLQEYKDKSASDLARLLASVMKEKEELRGQLNQALDRVNIVLDIQAAVEDERDMYKRMIADYESSSDILEDPVSGDEYGELADQLNSTKQLNEELLAKQKELEESEQAYKSKCSELESQLTQAREEFNSKSESLESSLLSDKSALEVEVTNAKQEISRLEEQLAQLESERADDIQAQLNSLQDKLTEAENNIQKNQSDLLTFSNAHSVSVSVIGRMAVAYKELSLSIEEKSKEVERLRTELNSVTNSLESKEVEIQQISERLASAEKVSNDYRQKIDIQLAEARSAVAVELATAQGELEATKQDRDRLESMLQRTKAELREKQTELDTLNIAVGPDLDASKQMAAANAVLAESNKTLGKTVGLLKQELADTKERLSKSTQIISNMQVNIDQLKTSVTAMRKGGISASGKLKLNCDYTGRGFIIPVFGSGSYGITTTAMSLARKISDSSVLYLDFDIVNPKADGWFNKSPLITGLEDIKNPLKRTGFGALLEKNTDYIVDHEKQIFQRAVENKGGFVDYFSGVYEEIDVTKLVAVDLTQFMNFCGNTYKYVIVDLGRFGSSDVGNALIKMFDDIAYRSIIVTLNNNADARNFGVKANAEKLKLGNSIWVLNMSESTKIEPIVKKSVGSANAIIFPRDPKFYGSGKTFDKASILKDKLQLIMGELLG